MQRSRQENSGFPFDRLSRLELGRTLEMSIRTVDRDADWPHQTAVFQLRIQEDSNAGGEILVEFQT